jgi:uncharacterized protein YbbC (DUF1343 family)
MAVTLTGLDRLPEEAPILRRLSGKVAFLCNSTSVDRNLRHGIPVLKELFGDRLRVVFTPQHGLLTDAQDNMIESPHFYHQYFGLPVYSLYSEVRKPTAAMLEGIDHLLVDLQDVGVRVYTYMHTVFSAMEACGAQGIDVTILDRPNPLGGDRIAGNVLKNDYRSFIGPFPLPMLHGMTLGELARMALQEWSMDCELRVVEMQGWERHMPFEATGLPWVFPSPNFPTLDTARVYPGMVLFEGTNLSEGRGTVRPFEIFGHPGLKAYEWQKPLQQTLKECGLEGVALRAMAFKPAFDKHAASDCRGFQLHVTDARSFRPWHTAQVLLRELFHLMGDHFVWRDPPFEYEYRRLPIDILNGNDRPRKWVKRQGSFEELEALEKEGHREFMQRRAEVLLYGRRMVH